MEQLQHTIDRAEWLAGPWDGEPDRWEGRHAGFPIIAVRNSMGAWCGYVGVPPGHRWHGVDYNGVELQAHGGLTYSGSCSGPICYVAGEGEPDEVWWLGFDCAHCDDLVPSMDAWRKGMPERPFEKFHSKDVYRTLEYVQQQARSMADQAAAAR